MKNVVVENLLSVFSAEATNCLVCLRVKEDAQTVLPTAKREKIRRQGSEDSGAIGCKIVTVKTRLRGRCRRDGRWKRFTGQDRRGVVSIKEDAQYWGFGLALSYVLRVMCADEQLKRPSGALFFQ